MHVPFLLRLLWMRRLLLLLCLLCLPMALCAEGLSSGLESACVYVRADAGATFLGFGGSNTGTGFPVSSDLVVTCDHLTRVPTIYGTAASRRLLVEVEPGRLAGAVVVERDPAHDLALLKVSEPCAGKPVMVGEFGLNRGDEVSIVGSFPDSVRVTRGSVISSCVLDGCAMATAKVRTGFSGGPVIGPDGTVQGMLSQRDDRYNAIFVRSDAILALLNAYERRSGREVLAPMRRAARLRPIPATGAVLRPAPAAGGLAGPARVSDRFAHPNPGLGDYLVANASPTPKPVEETADTLLAVPVRKAGTAVKTLLASPPRANAGN
jgi:hypothetical protein